MVINPDDVPEEEVEVERQLALDQAAAAGKPQDIQAKMVAGKLKKFREERALISQSFVKDPTKTIAELIHEAVTELGENITINEFSRLSI